MADAVLHRCLAGRSCRGFLVTAVGRHVHTALTNPLSVRPAEESSSIRTYATGKGSSKKCPGRGSPALAHSAFEPNVHQPKKRVVIVKIFFFPVRKQSHNGDHCSAVLFECAGNNQPLPVELFLLMNEP